MDDGSVLTRLLHTPEIPPTLTSPSMQRRSAPVLAESDYWYRLVPNLIDGKVIAFTCYMLHATCMHIFALRGKEEG